MGTDREGDIMQLTNTTDYAIRIVCYLASENKVITTAELSRELNIPASYIPKITKQLKEKEIVKAAEGSNGGYMLEKRPEEISLILYKSFLLWTLLTVQSQQWQLADVWRRTDTVPEIIQIAARYIRCYWICRTLIITGWKM